MTKKLYIKTYGCQMNEYDSGKIIDVLQSKEKIELIDKPADADIVILNTCSIREKAEEKVFHELGRIRKFKEKNKDLKIGVAGCVAAQEGKNIFKRAPYVNVVFGPHQQEHELHHKEVYRRPLILDMNIIQHSLFPYLYQLFL